MEERNKFGLVGSKRFMAMQDSIKYIDDSYLS